MSKRVRNTDIEHEALGLLPRNSWVMALLAFSVLIPYLHSGLAETKRPTPNARNDTSQEIQESTTPHLRALQVQVSSVLNMMRARQVGEGSQEALAEILERLANESAQAKLPAAIVRKIESFAKLVVGASEARGNKAKSLADQAALKAHDIIVSMHQFEMGVSLLGTMSHGHGVKRNEFAPRQISHLHGNLQSPDSSQGTMTSRQRCAKAGIDLPSQVPRPFECIAENKECNGWRFRAALDPNKISAGPNQGAFVFTYDSGSTSCWYLYRQRDEVEADPNKIADHGVLCFKTTDCSICSFDHASTSAELPRRLDDFADQPGIGGGMDCSTCHLPGPVAPTMALWEKNLVDELEPLNSLCSSKGGPTWIGREHTYVFPKGDTTRIVSPPSGCNDCHTGGFVADSSATSSYCSLIGKACSEPVGAMHISNKNISENNLIRENPPLTALQMTQLLGAKLGCPPETFEGCQAQDSANPSHVWLLTESFGGGSISVDSPKSEKSCGQSCYIFPPDSEVVLTARPPRNGELINVSPCNLGKKKNSDGSMTCNLLLNDNTHVVARSGFKLITAVEPSLANGSQSPGDIEIDADLTPCAGWKPQRGERACYIVEPQTPLQLTALENSGWAFFRYSRCPGLPQGPRCFINMPAEATKVTADFEKGPLLTVVNRQPELGTVRQVQGDKIVCGESCEANFLPGSSVILSAESQANCKFAGWEGACSGTSPQCRIQMTQSKRVVANFRTCDCTGRTCGDDGCGNSCGQCPKGQVCDGRGQCIARQEPPRRPRHPIFPRFPRRE